MTRMNHKIHLMFLALTNNNLKLWFRNLFRIISSVKLDKRTSSSNKWGASKTNHIKVCVQVLSSMRKEMKDSNLPKEFFNNKILRELNPKIWKDQDLAPSNLSSRSESLIKGSLPRSLSKSRWLRSFTSNNLSLKSRKRMSWCINKRSMLHLSTSNNSQPCLSKTSINSSLPRILMKNPANSLDRTHHHPNLILMINNHRCLSELYLRLLSFSTINQ